MLKQIKHSVHSDKNESESLDLGRGLGIGTGLEVSESRSWAKDRKVKAEGNTTPSTL